jgi:hypothetical protein
MRKLSPEDVLFGLVEGEEYTIYTSENVLFSNYVFGGYSLQNPNVAVAGIYGFFSDNVFRLWEIDDDKPCNWHTIDGWYVTTKD